MMLPIDPDARSTVYSAAMRPTSAAMTSGRLADHRPGTVASVTLRTCRSTPAMIAVTAIANVKVRTPDD